MSCRRSSRFWGLGCPKIFHEIEDSLGLREHGYRYLVVSRERQRRFDPQRAVSIHNASGETLQLEKVLSEDGQEVRLYCHSERRAKKEKAINERFAKRFEEALEKIAAGLSKPRTTKRIRCPPWRAKRRRVVPGSREATRDTRRAEGAKGDPKGASERGVQSYGRPVCSRNELAMLWRNAG